MGIQTKCVLVCYIIIEANDDDDAHENDDTAESDGDIPSKDGPSADIQQLSPFFVN